VFRLVDAILMLKRLEKGEAQTINDIRRRMSGRARGDNADTDSSKTPKCYTMTDFRLGSRWQDIGNR